MARLERIHVFLKKVYGAITREKIKQGTIPRPLDRQMPLPPSRPSRRVASVPSPSTPHGDSLQMGEEPEKKRARIVCVSPRLRGRTDAHFNVLVNAYYYARARRARPPCLPLPVPQSAISTQCRIASASNSLARLREIKLQKCS